MDKWLFSRGYDDRTALGYTLNAWNEVATLRDRWQQGSIGLLSKAAAVVTAGRAIHNQFVADDPAMDVPFVGSKTANHTTLLPSARLARLHARIQTQQ